VNDLAKRSPTWALVVAYAAAYIPLYLFPYQVTAYLEIQHSTAGQAGLLSMIETASLAASNIMMVLVPQRWRMRFAIGGSLLAAAGELASIYVLPLQTLMIFRAVVGAGFGVAGFTAAQLVAVSIAPSRTFGACNGVLAVASGILLGLVPHLPGNAGVRVFIPLAVVALCLAPTLARASRAQRAAVPLPLGATTAAGRWLTIPVVGMFLVALLLFVPLGGLYVFAGYQGAHLGMSDSAVGMSLGWTTVTGLAGGTAAAWMCARWGLVYPMVSTCVLAAATCIAIGMAAGAELFVLAFVLFGITYMFAMTTISSVCAAADSTGRAAAVLVGWQVFAVAIGSALVGYLLDGERPELAWQIGALACAVATIPAAFSARTVDILSPIVTKTSRGSLA
jgi:hypothetical protein